MDLNYSRDTTSGREGLELIPHVRAHDAVDADRRHDRLGQRRYRRRGDAAGREAASCRSRGKTSTLARDPAARDRGGARDAAPRREAAARVRRSPPDPARPAADGACRRVPGLELASSWQPANGVGGDCFDALPFGATAIGLSIADVAGKGVPAALLMSNLQAAVRAFAQDGAAPSAVCASVNRLLCRNMASRPLRHVLLRAHRRRGRTPDVRQRRAQPAAARFAPTAPSNCSRPAAPSSASSRRAPTSRGNSPSVPAIASCSIPTASPRAGTPPATSTARSASLDAARRFRTLPAEEMLASLLEEIDAFNGGTYEDDATLIIAAL